VNVKERKNEKEKKRYIEEIQKHPIGKRETSGRGRLGL